MALFKRKAGKQAKKVMAKPVVKVANDGKPKRRTRLRAPRFIRATGNYFVGAWSELRQVRWPDRKATWSLTVAVIMFTFLLMLFILLIDNFFGWLFEQLVL